MNNLNIVIKTTISISGKMVGEYVNIDFSMPRYYDLLTYYTADDAKIKLNKFIKKYDSIDCITVTLTNEDDCILLDKLFDFSGELRVMEWNTVQKIRENEILLVNNKENTRKIYIMINTFIKKVFIEMDRIYTEYLFERKKGL